MSAQWTSEMVADLRRLHATSMSFSEIGEVIGVSRNAAIGKARRLGLERLERMNWQERDRRRVEALKRRNEVKRQRRRDVSFKPRVQVSMLPPKPTGDLSGIAMHVSLLDLEPHQCRFPFGDGPFTFCGHQKMLGSSYCPSHTALCIGSGTPSERRAHEVSKRVTEAA